ncbi:MAG: PaaI family thioesterase [Pseudomonadales bacterium]|nr:PaaI family thioesterase [Pseudomonadales bacterium]
MTFDEHIGMQFSQGDDRNEAWIDIESHHQNPTGNINGGVIISLADNLATGAANRAWSEKTGERAFLVGVDLHAVMLANQHGGRIHATAEPVRVGRRITVIRTTVRGDAGKILAEVTTTHVPVQ